MVSNMSHNHFKDMRITLFILLTLLLGSWKQQKESKPTDPQAAVIRQELKESRDSLTELIENLETEKNWLLQSTSKNNPVVQNLNEAIAKLKAKQQEMEGQLLPADQ